jgi:hypothetical protein
MPAVPDSLRTLGIEDIIALDTEYISQKGEPVVPVCLCAKSLITRHRTEEFSGIGNPPCPLSIASENLFVSYSAPAEWSYFLAKGWELPPSIIDLYAEMSLRLNGQKDERGKRMSLSLLAALQHHGFDGISSAQKAGMRELILRGGPFSPGEMRQILEYCWTDVESVEKLFWAMLPHFDVYQAMQRGAYTRVVAEVEARGIPVDEGIYRDLKDKWPTIRANLAMEVERKYGYGVYIEDEKGAVTWSEKGFAALVQRKGLGDVWPKTETGKFSAADSGADGNKIFKRMTERCPELEPLRVVRKTLAELHKFDLSIGADGRARCNPRPWASKTGRNQPLAGFIFALPKWVRRLITPAVGQALAYVDLRACEFGIVAALTKDPEMMRSYRSGQDVYLRVAKLAGAVPSDATKSSHPDERSLYKTATLGLLYGLSRWGLSRNTGCGVGEAEEMFRNLERIYERFFVMRDRMKLRAEIRGYMESGLGWRVPVNSETRTTFLYNFPIQSTGADILRAASTMMLDEGIKLCALVHDAVLIEDCIETVEQSVAIVQKCWHVASESILHGFPLDSDVEIVRYPGHFEPEGTKEFWRLLTDLCAKKGEHDCETEVQHETQTDNDLPRVLALEGRGSGR